MARRIAYLTHYAELYGANRSLLDLMVTLRSSKEVEPFVIVAQDGPLCRKLEEHGIAHEVIPFSTWMHKHVFMGGPHHRLLQRWRYRRQGRSRDKLNAALIPRLVAICLEWRIQLVHVNSSVIGVGEHVANELGVPLVWHIRELPFLHYRFRVDGGTGRYRHALRNADALIAISDAVRVDLEATMGSEDRIHVVPNGVVRGSQLQELKSSGGQRWSCIQPFRFVQIGLFHPSKGQTDAIEAFARVHADQPNTHLTLAGGGRREEAQRRMHELHLDGSVDLPGFVEDPYSVLQEAHCLLQCSRHEAMGRATVEAMASGIPVIGHASGATPELIEQGRTGQLYMDVDELVGHMRAMVIDTDEAKRMGGEAQTVVAERFTVEGMCDGVSTIYRSLLKKA